MKNNCVYGQFEQTFKKRDEKKSFEKEHMIQLVN